MNIAYFIYHGNIIEWDLFDTCIKSLQKVSDCKIVVYTPELKNYQYLEKQNVKIVHFDMKDWENRKMTCKVECVLTLQESCDIKENDNVMVFDSDLFFIKDPFDVFKTKEFDFFYTTRNMNSEYAVNGGVWGFKYNQKSKNLLEFFVENLNNPTWPPYLNARLNHNHNNDLKNLDWWVDQDFLCELNNNKDLINKGKLGFDVTIIDAGPKYNWIYTGMSVNEQLEHVKNKNSHILHFKGSSGKRWDEFSLYDEEQIGFYKKILEMI